MEWETKCRKFYTYLLWFCSISADFLKTLTHFCNLFIVFLLSKRTLYVGGGPSLNLVLITQNINCLKTKNSRWSFTLRYSIFLCVSCVIFPSWHQLHLGSQEILVFLSTFTVACLIEGRGKFLFWIIIPPVALF